jgi:hypothetical protein
VSLVLVGVGLAPGVAWAGGSPAGGGLPANGVSSTDSQVSLDGETAADVSAGLSMAVMPGSGVEPAAADESAAAAAAAALGHRVEIASLTTETGRHLANPDGTVLFESYAAPQRVRRDGGWVPVDTTLQVVDGRVVPAATLLELSLSAGGGDEVIRLVDDGRRVSLSWQGLLPEPVLSGDTARYREVLPGVDLVVRVGVDSFSQVLQVKSRQAAADPALSRLAWRVTTDGLTLRLGEQGSVDAVDEVTGEVVFAAPPSLMWDSPQTDDELFSMMGEPAPVRTGLGDVDEPGRVEVMPTELVGDQLVVRPVRSMLKDPRTTFPVFIDPGFTGLIMHWANVFQQSSGQGWTNDSLWPREGGMRVGLLDWPGCGSGCGLWRSVVRFGVSSNVHDRHVVSAAVKMTQTHTGGCGEYYINLWQINGFTSGVSWNGVNWLHGSYLQRRKVASSNSIGGCSTSYPNRSVTFNNSSVRSTVQNAANKEFLSVSYGVRSNSEGSRNEWRRISRDSLRLEVTYDAYPNTPTSVTIAGGSADCHSTCASPATVRVTRPWLQGRVSKSFTSDFPNVRAEFQLRNFATGEIIATHTTSLQAAPRTFEWRAPTLTNGTEYRFRVRGINSSGGAGSWSSYFRFKINTTGPGTPTGVGVFSTGSCFPAGSCASPAMLNDRRPFFKATPQHPLKDDATLVFEIRNQDRSQVVSTGTVRPAAAAKQATWRPSSNLPQEATMHLRVRSTGDLLGRSGSWSPYFTFTVDTSPPNQPTVSSPLYAHKDTGTWNGGVGQPGSFTFGANGAGDVVSYQWRFNGGLVTTVNVSKGSGHTVNLNPPGDLQQLLEVRSLDHAGNASSWRAYLFYVRPQPADAGYWKFDEGSGTTAASAVAGSGFDGVLRGGATWAASGINPVDPAASGSVVMLNGTDAYVEMPPVLATNHAAGLTVSGWVNPTDLSTDRTVVAQRGDNTYMFRLYYRDASDQWCFEVRHDDQSSATSSRACSTMTPQTGEWTHLVGVYDNPTGTIWLWVNGGPNNGAVHPPGEVVQATAPAAWPATGSFQVGRAFSGAFFAGRVDEVRAYQRVVPEVEVVHMYLSCLDDICPPAPEPDPITLVGAWDFEETSASTAEDGSGLGNHATLQGDAQWTVFGLRDTRGLWFDGDTGYAATDGPVLLTDQSFTVSAWARLDHLPASGEAWVLQTFGQGISAMKLIYIPGLQKWRFAVSSFDGTSTTWHIVDSQAVVQAGQWTHLAGVYDAAAGQLRLYLDGQPHATRSGVTVRAADSDLHIGGHPGGHGLPGTVDTVRVYQGAATDAQVAAWYADQSAPLPDPEPPFLAGDWRMDEQAGPAVMDHTFSGNDGLLSGGVGWPDPGQAYAGTYGLVFDGQTGAVSTFFPPVLTDEAFTLAGWMNPVSTGGDRAAVAIEGTHAAVATLGYDTGAGAYCFTMAHNDVAAADTTSACAATAPQVGAWTHLVGVFDRRARQVLLYVDGQLAAAVTYGGLETWQAWGALAIGRTLVDGQPDHHWHGRVALVRAYQGALTAAGVADLHQQQLDPTPTAVITTPAGGQWSAGQQVSFSGHGVDLSGQLPVSALTWVLSTYDCEDPTDPGCDIEVLQTWTGVGSGSFTTPDRSDPVNLRLELTVDNGSGLLGVASAVLQPATVTLTFTTDPQGLDLNVASHTAETPVMLTVVQGATVDLSAPEPQEVDEVLYGFDSWAHGGQASQQITAPASATTYTATYLPLDHTPTAVIDSPAVELTWTVGQQINIAGHATDPTGALPDSALSWRIVAYRCEDDNACLEEAVVAEWSAVNGGAFTAPDVTYPAYLEIELTADNGPGWVDTAAVQLDPQLVELTVTTDPAGLELTVGGITEVTPFTLPAILGSTLELSALSPQDHQGQAYVFDAWANGGDATHTITAPATPATYTATYTAGAGQPTGSVVGQVICNGQTVSGATVTMAGVSTSTDFFGMFGLHGLPTGIDTLTVQHPIGWCSVWSSPVAVVEGESTWVTVVMPNGCDPATC